MNDFEKWTPPEFSSDKSVANHLEQQKQKYQKEFESGYQAGLEKGVLDAQVQLEKKEAALGQLMLQMDAELKNMTTALSEPMVRLVQYLVSTLLHEAQCLEPEVLVKMVQDTLKQVDDLSGPVTVMLNPVHYQHVLSYLEKHTQILDKVQLKASEAIQVGGCHIDASHLFYDNSLDTRLKNLIRNLLMQLPAIAPSQSGMPKAVDF